MRINYLIIFCTIVLSTDCYAQSSLYIPRDIQRAYKNETRSMDGKPGKNYWQNRAIYNISVEALVPDRRIKGSEQIMYYNNSNDTLSNPVIRMLLNIHKPGAPRDGGAQNDYLTQGMQIDNFSVNGIQTNWQKNPFRFTWQPFRLPEPLAPHDSVQLSFDWHYEISLESNREGMIDSTTYFLAYFYPRIAVFDDYAGWDRMDFTDGKEFYSDFNDYTVNIKVPKNFIVWGTGTLQNPENLLQPTAFSRFQQSFTSDETISVATRADLESGKVTKQNAINNWQFMATNIPDMAFGLSDHFVWDAGSVIVDNTNGRRASVQAAYNDTAKDYRQMVSYGKHALNWFSNNWPGIPYPYEKTTIFQGYAGMEYPMMANDETYEDPIFSRFVAEHEIAHTYMPFYMGTNESRFGFMDEGWATALELLIGRADLGTEKAEELFKQFRVEGWIYDESQDQDLPIITPSNVLNGRGMANNEYGKAALGYLAMKDLLGDEVFKKCLLEYMSRWNSKHPTPWDFFFTFNDASGNNLNWFWANWFFSNNYIDLGIANLVKSKSGYALKIKNTGGMAAPVNLSITYEDGTSEILHQTPAIWQNNQKETTVIIKARKKIKSIKLDGGIFMDANEEDNSWPLK